jgi:hypothetical protein
MTRFIPGMERLVRVEQTGPWVPLGRKESLLGRQWQMRAQTLIYETQAYTETTDCEREDFPQPGPPGSGGPPVGSSWHNVLFSNTPQGPPTVREVRNYAMRCVLFDPPKALPEVQYAAGSLAFLNGELAIEQNWVRNVSGVKSYGFTLDNKPVRHMQRIRFSELGVGYHVIDFDVTLDDGATRHYQGGFNVQPRLEVRFDDPVTPWKFAPATDPMNGTILRFTVTNLSPLPVTAFVGVDGVPQGWKVGLLDDPIFELGPNRRKRCRLQVEMMHALGYSADPLPFTVSARSPATDLPASSGGAPDRAQTTGYVQLKVARRTAEKLEAQQKWARRHHGVLALGPTNGWKKNQLLR